MKNRINLSTTTIAKEDDFESNEVAHVKKDLLKSLVLSILAIGSIVVISFLQRNPNLINYFLRR
ncbi:MAG TPA: hypothetical protein VF828_00030 [Patescibacteria group bacterium]